ncbi:MAG: ABC-type dipeptide transport system, periplasmic component [Dehalococcoidia bacterium]|nr:ABC-type dipeptide transport system, periplasmic component [Dehalococcoidia bacterium]
MLAKAKFTTLLALLAVGNLLLAACAPSAAPTGEKGAAPAEKAATGDQIAPSDKAPKRGGTITINYGSSWNADPGMGQTPYTTWYRTGEPMIRRDPVTFELQPASFESWKVSPDGKEITLKVRQGVKFHNKPPINGREMEARDLVYVLKSATGLQYPELSPVRFPRKESFKGMIDAVAVDKYTVKVTLENPSVSFLHAMADYRGTYVYPDGLREAFGGVESLVAPNPDRSIGAGPFVFTKFTTAVESIFDRNPTYWQPGKPYLDRVRLLQVADTSTEQAAFVAKQLDFLSLATIQAREFVTKYRKDIQVVTYAPESCWNRLSLNTKRKPFDDYRVRRAVYLVIDKNKIGETIYGFTLDGKPMWRLPGPLPWPFPEAIPQEELAKHPLYQGPTPENVAEAKRLMKEAGYEGGFAFDMHLDRGRSDAAQLIERDLATNLGIKTNLKVVDTETHRALAARGEYDAQLYCHIHDVTAVAHLAQAFHSKGGRNYGQYSNPELDALLDKAEMELDPVKYKALLREIQTFILDKSLAFLPTRHNMGTVAMQPDVRGARFGAGTGYNLGVADWWRDK